MKLLQIVGGEAASAGGARSLAGRLQAEAGGEVLALAELPKGESADAALKRALEREAPEAALVHLGLASPGLLMLLRERGVRFAAFLHDYAPLCPTQRLWHRRGERCAGPGRTGWKCAWCVSGGRLRAGAEVPLRALLYRHRPQAWRTALAGAEALIAPSHFARERWIDEGAPPERIAVIPPAPAAAVAPRAPGGARRLVFAGGWDEAEGAELLAAALELVRRPVRLEVAGGDPAGARWRAALAAPHTLVLLPPGATPELDAATVVAEPARCDTPFSAAVAAAQAAGARPVATAMGAAAEQIVHGGNGFLAAPDDPAALEEALEEAFAAPWDAGAAVARAAAAAAASLAALGRLLELIAAGAAAPALRLEHGAWLERRAAARGETVEEGLRELEAALREMPVVEDAELTRRAQQTSRRHRLALNHAVAYLRACGCRRATVLPPDAPGADEARRFLGEWGFEMIAESELPDGVLHLADDDAADLGWMRRRFPQLKAYVGISAAGTDTYSDLGD